MLEEIKKFYEKTKFKFGELQKLPKGIEVPLNWIRVFYKTYPRFPKIELKIPEKETEFSKLLKKRVSRRDFKDCPINFEDIERILYLSSGLKSSDNENLQPKRFYPSAGARYPIEVYLLANNIEGLSKGLYHYNVKSNTLEEILKKDLSGKSIRLFGQDISKGNPNFIILTGVMSRSEVKYGLNAYRFGLIESGHIGQNIYLLSEEQRLGCCAIGGFDNELTTKLLDLSDDEIPLYVFALGKTN